MLLLTQAPALRVRANIYRQTLVGVDVLGDPQERFAPTTPLWKPHEAGGETPPLRVRCEHLPPNPCRGRRPRRPAGTPRTNPTSVETARGGRRNASPTGVCEHLPPNPCRGRRPRRPASNTPAPTPPLWKLHEAGGETPPLRRITRSPKMSPISPQDACGKLI